MAPNWRPPYPSYVARFRPEVNRVAMAIFAEAVRYLSACGAAARLRLYHEVTVAAADDQHFEYLGCHSGTGLLKAAAG